MKYIKYLLIGIAVNCYAYSSNIILNIKDPSLNMNILYMRDGTEVQIHFDENGLAQGKSYIFYDSKNYKVINYINGVLQGEAFSHYQDLEQRYEYKDNYINGILYNISENIDDNYYTLKDGLLDGPSYLKNSNGTVIYEEYKEGAKDGFSYTILPDGTEYIENFSKGMLNGYGKYIYPNGEEIIFYATNGNIKIL